MPDIIDPRKILIIGAGGQLGATCLKKWPNATAVDRNDLDITNKEAVFDVVSNIKPDLIINTTAYTNVEESESDLETAYKVNALGPLYIAQAASKNEATFVHISTDYVFAGVQSSYTENDPVSPINAYGLSKAAGEQAVAAYCEDHYIVRTSALFGPRKNNRNNNFVAKRLLQLESGAPIYMVNDQETVPTYTDDLADCLYQLIQKKGPFGIYHVVNSGGPVTWFEFTKQIAATAGYQNTIEPISSKESTSVVNRPVHGVLEDTKLALLGISMPTWQDALKRYINE